MKAKLAAAGLLGALIVASTSDAQAGDTKAFAEKGNLIISADRLVPLLSYTDSSVTRTENNIEATDSQNGTSLSLLYGVNLANTGGINVPVNVHTIPRVAFDITIIPHLTLGAAFAFAFGLGGTVTNETVVGNGKVTTERDAPTATAFGIAPRVGYILPIGDLFAFWPRGGIGIYGVSASTEGVDGNTITRSTNSDTFVSLDLDPQFALVPFEHFFFHFGPLINVPLSTTRSSTIEVVTGGQRAARELDLDASLFNFGITAGLGGWFSIF